MSQVYKAHYGLTLTRLSCIFLKPCRTILELIVQCLIVVIGQIFGWYRLAASTDCHKEVTVSLILPNLPVAYHQQDNDYSCGAACAEMLLVSPAGGTPLGGSLADPRFQQTKKKSSDPDGLYDLIRKKMNALPSCVAGYFDTGKEPGTHPDVLAEVLNMYSTAAGKKFKVFASTNQEDIACRVAYTLFQHGIAPVILMWGGQHWSAVTGCNYMRADEGIDIIDFLVQDPFPRLELSAPPPATPHAAGDECGDGAISNSMAGGTTTVDYRGFINVHIPYNIWCCEYMAHPIPKAPPTSSSVGALNDMYVAVCAVKEDDSDAKQVLPPAPFSISTSALPCPAAPNPVDHSLDADLKLTDPVSVTKAITVAVNNLTATTYSLINRSPWSKVIGSLANRVESETVTAMKRLGVVKRFAKDAPDFFLVPFVLGDGTIPVVVRIALDPDKIVPALGDPNNLDGFDYVDSILVPLGGTAIASRDLDPVRIRNVYFPILPSDDNGPSIPPGTDLDLHIIAAELVWTPCLQSFSPFIPFYDATVTGFGVPDGQHIFLRGDFQLDGNSESLDDDTFVEPNTNLGGV